MRMLPILAFLVPLAGATSQPRPPSGRLPPPLPEVSLETPAVATDYATTTHGSIECQISQKKCQADTDCYHRAMYLHSACSSGTCQPQCKTAVLNLYQTSLGRALLHTDVGCVGGGVAEELERCGLLPDADGPLHCTLAHLLCQAKDECARRWDVFEGHCLQEPNETRHACSSSCAHDLAGVLQSTGGARLGTCVCWAHDPLCRHFKAYNLQACLDSATAEAADEGSSRRKPSGKEISADSNDSHRLGSLPMPKLGSEEDKPSGASCLYCSFSLCLLAYATALLRL